MVENLKTLYMYKEIHEQPEAVKHAHEVNIDKIKEFVKIIKEKGITNIIMVARGSSMHACNYFKYVCEIYAGMPVGFANPSVTSVYGKVLNYKNTLVIGVSQSGGGVDVAEVIKGARSAGALTLAITNFPDSLIATTAEYHLCLSCTKELSVAATKTFTVQMYLLALLAAELGDSDELRNDLSKVSDLLASQLAKEDEIFTYARKFKDMNECFVLARGLNYVSCLECALKLQETTYVRSKGFGIADFHHGPFAAIDNGSIVFLTHADGVMNKDADEMFEKLSGAGASITMITNSDKYANYDKVIKFNKCPESIACFAVVETMQLFACQLSVTKGNSPDTPRGLKKVTVTK